MLEKLNQQEGLKLQVKKIFCLLLLMAVIGSSSIAFAGNKETENAELEELKQLILELKQQMNEMKRKHESEINALKEEISRLRKPAEEIEVEDELASLRELAESMAGEKKEKKKP